ncbi:MAG TPA: hypothetical protein VLV86_11940, partial [Vicinamibacterales bacterium]|nr:hypothetical protein [Vicinamibacterales bacterium]
MTKHVLAAGVWLGVICSVACGHSNPASTSTTAAPSAPAPSAKLALSQSSYHFPDTPVGQGATSPTFNLSATGSGSLTVASVTSSSPTEFPLVNPAGCVGMTLVGGASSTCVISAKFQPVTAGVRSAEITVTSSDGGSIVLDMFGSAFSNGSAGGDGGGGGGGGGGG